MFHILATCKIEVWAHNTFQKTFEIYYSSFDVNNSFYISTNNRNAPINRSSMCERKQCLNSVSQKMILTLYSLWKNVAKIEILQQNVTICFLLVFNKLSFIKWSIWPDVFSYSMKLVVVELSNIHIARWMGQLPLTIHLVPCPLSLIHHTICCCVCPLPAPLQGTSLCLAVLSICSNIVTS